MGWVIFAGVLILLILALRRTGKRSVHSQSFKAGANYVVRDGETSEADSAFDAWTSRDLERMVAQINVKTNLVDRHFLLMGIVKQAYKERNRPEMRQLVHKVAQLHIKEFPRICPALVRFLHAVPGVSTFELYAKLLTEEGRYDEAIAVCQKAIDFGVTEQTKGGYPGRIERIKRKRDKAQK